MKLVSAKDSSLLLSLDHYQFGRRAVLAKLGRKKIAEETQLAWQEVL